MRSFTTKLGMLLVAMLTVAVSLLLFVGQPVLAETPEQICASWTGSDKPAYCASISDPNKDPVGSDGIVYKVTNLISYAAGVIGVFWIIIQAIKISTAQGNSQKVAEARNGIIYALVGLAVVLVARTLIMFALSRL